MELIAHRGASGYAPENTMESFGLALEMGMRNFEFDVHLTKDGMLAVHHDYSLRRTAGSDDRIEELTCGELKKYNINRHLFPGKKCPVPFLGEVLEKIKRAGGLINVEIKNDKNIYKGIESMVLKEVVKAGIPWSGALFTSFDYATVKRVRALEQKARVGILGRHLFVSLAIRKAKAVGAVCVNFDRRLVSERKVKAVHKAGLKTYVYTVNDTREALKLKEMGVDGIFTNYPDILTKPRKAEK